MTRNPVGEPNGDGDVEVIKLGIIASDVAANTKLEKSVHDITLMGMILNAVPMAQAVMVLLAALTLTQQTGPRREQIFRAS